VPFVTANGVKLHVQELGEGPTVVMLHGLLVGSLASWYFTAAPVLSRTHRVVLYDLRGHGLSDAPPSGYDVATQVRDLDAILASPLPLAGSQGQSPVALVGHSFGALIALRYALEHPERVSRLALIEVPLPPSRFEEFDAFLQRPPETMLEALPEALQRTITEGRRQARRLVQKVLHLTRDTTLLADLRAERDEADAELTRIRCPTLLAFGTGSSLRPVGARLALSIPGARLIELPGGHYLHLDATEALTGALDEFLRV
jgi:pimeloyl-ACP methyl ester carboxylesterase